MPAAQEQRRYHRYQVRFPCVVRRSRGRKAKHGLTAATVNVSASGLFFVADANWDVGTGIECWLRLPPGPVGSRTVAIRCRGKIVRVIGLESGEIGVGATIETYKILPLDPSPVAPQPGIETN